MGRREQYGYVSEYRLEKYSDELAAGDVVINKMEIVSKYSDGRVSYITPAHSRHFVLKGVVGQASEVWLGVKDPDPRRHVWGLDQFWDTFEKTDIRHEFDHGEF